MRLIHGLICLRAPGVLSFWLILNQAEIILTDRLSGHLQHMEITTTFVVYIMYLQVCVAAVSAGQDFVGHFEVERNIADSLFFV